MAARLAARLALLVAVLASAAPRPVVAGVVESPDPLQGSNAAWWRSIGLEAAPPPGEHGRTVAIVDTGIDASHEDLAGLDAEAFAALPREADGTCGGEDCCPPARAPAHSFHGTAVAGVITAMRGNGRGIAGIGRAGRLVSIDALQAERGAYSRLAAGIECALDKGARLINVSIQGMAAAVAPPELDAALGRAARSDALVVIAAGNGIGNLDLEPEWPAASRARTSLTVTAVDLTDRLTGQHYGLRSVDLAAPATERMVCSTFPASDTPARHAEDGCASSASARYGRFGQTSAAAAMVSGSALLAWSHPNYRDCSAEQLRAVLLKHARVPADETTRGALSPLGGVLDLHFLSDIVHARGGVLDLCSGVVR